MERVYICYRREDASGHAGRLYDHLTERLGESTVFMDIDTIPLGEKFDTYIEENLRDCYMCIVVIGKHWNIERLHSDNDYVRKEIVAAFTRGIRIIPVLFDGAKLPNPADLPLDMTELTKWQAYDFGTGRDFKKQISELLKEVNRAIKEEKKRRMEQSREALRGIALRPYQYPIWVLFLFSLIVLSTIASLTWVPTQVSALGHLWKGKASISKEDPTTAINYYRSALEREPTSHITKINLAIALFMKKTPEADVEAINIVDNIKTNITNDEWDRIKPVLPDYLNITNSKEMK